MFPRFPSRLGLMLSGRQPIDELIASARAAEAAGFHSVWSGDGGGDVFSLLTAYALATQRIRLGAGVAVWHRPPIVAAQAAGQLSRISGGRFILGLGAGPRDWNEDWWGISFDRPITRMKEYVEIVRGALSLQHGVLNYAGKVFQVRNYRRRVAAPVVPPIYLGTVGPQMNRLAGQVADGVLFDVCLPPSYLTAVAIPAVDAGLARAGRTREQVCLAAMVPAAVSADRRAARRFVKRAIAGHLENDYFYPVWRAAGFEAEALAAREKLRARDIEGALDAISDDFAATVGICGTPDEARQQAARWLALLDIVVLLAPPFGAADDEVAGNRRALIDTFGA
ncbi:MAG: LLM class flavin-dependent oxidoreductase [Chloroflexota bacterium]|nr:LLM class flavin-dependent oxidoreductase [Dehalococcoidia bacterium]MDW8254850.1 LLM class flavin-dependent oxidoreductase [Chloroflexota bacterium]